MMLALAFAGVGLVSTIVDGVMVQPSKEEKKLQEERTAQLSKMIAEDVEKRIGLMNIEFPSETGELDLNIETPAKPEADKPKPNVEANGGVDTTSPVVPKPDPDIKIDSLASGDKKPQVKKEKEEEVLVIIEQYHLNKDKTLGKGVVDNLKEMNVPAAKIIEQSLLNKKE